MVYGNLGTGSATGVCFTRNPITGRAELYGKCLVNAQGEDVVQSTGVGGASQRIAFMRTWQPDVYDQLVTNCRVLEEAFCDMQVCTLQARYLVLSVPPTSKLLLRILAACTTHRHVAQRPFA
jgi:phosphoenolpyruvate synthase/pyruvate phosphate dikinase